MTSDEIIAAVRSIADKDKVDPVAQMGDMITLSIEEQTRFATLIRNQTLEEAAVKFDSMVADLDSDKYAAAIRSMKT